MSNFLMFIIGLLIIFFLIRIIIYPQIIVNIMTIELIFVILFGVPLLVILLAGGFNYELIVLMGIPVLLLSITFFIIRILQDKRFLISIKYYNFFEKIFKFYKLYINTGIILFAIIIQLLRYIGYMNNNIKIISGGIFFIFFFFLFFSFFAGDGFEYDNNGKIIVYDGDKNGYFFRGIIFYMGLVLSIVIPSILINF